jgi:Tfp pilus assembly protein PilO
MPFDFSREYYRYRKYFLTVPRAFGAKKTRVYTGLILSILAIAFFSLFALRPTFLTIAGLLAEIKDKEEINQRLSQKITALSQAQTVFTQTIASRAYLLDEALPKEDRLDKLLASLEMAGSQSQINFSGLDFEKIKIGNQNKGLAEIGLAAAVSGSYQAVKDFFVNLTGGRRLINIKSFSLISRQQEKGNDLLLSIQLKSFFQAK